MATLSFLEFLYGILLVLSRCCFHRIVENSILDKKDIPHFYIGPILYSENKIIRSLTRWSVEKLTVKFYLAPGVRNRKFYLAPGMRNGKIYLAPNDSFEKLYLAIKGLKVSNDDDDDVLGIVNSIFCSETFNLVIAMFTFEAIVGICRRATRPRWFMDLRRSRVAAAAKREPLDAAEAQAGADRVL